MEGTSTASGFWLLASGFWLLDSGFWLLASGFEPTPTPASTHDTDFQGPWQASLLRLLGWLHGCWITRIHPNRVCTGKIRVIRVRFCCCCLLAGTRWPVASGR